MPSPAVVVGHTDEMGKRVVGVVALAGVLAAVCSWWWEREWERVIAAADPPPQWGPVPRPGSAPSWRR